MDENSVIPYNDPLMAYVGAVDYWTDETPGFERKGLRITFHNGLTLSAVRGEHIYNDADTFEIAVIGSLDSDDRVKLLYVPEWGDTVCGYQTFEQVRAFAWRVALEGYKLTGESK